MELPDDEYQSLTVVMQKRNEQGVIGKTYATVRDKIKTIDVYRIDTDNNLLDKDNNIIMEPDNINPVPLRITNKKIFAATWIPEEE